MCGCPGFLQLCSVLAELMRISISFPHRMPASAVAMMRVVLMSRSRSEEEEEGPKRERRSTIEQASCSFNERRARSSERRGLFCRFHSKSEGETRDSPTDVSRVCPARTIPAAAAAAAAAIAVWIAKEGRKERKTEEKKEGLSFPTPSCRHSRLTDWLEMAS